MVIKWTCETIPLIARLYLLASIDFWWNATLFFWCYVHFFRGTNSTNSTNSNGLQWNIFTYLELQSPMDSNGLKWTRDSPTVSNYLINELQKAPMGSIGLHRSSIVIVNDLLICQQWTPKDYNGLIWATMGSNGLQWAPMGSNGLQLALMDWNQLHWTPVDLII